MKNALKIIVADHDLIGRMLLVTTLEGFGFEVASASNGLEAWNLFQQEPSRIVVSDWLMPRMDGLELCRQIRAQHTGDYVYFILLTQRDSGLSPTLAVDAGVDDFLLKPLDREQIFLRLRVAERIIQYTRQIIQLERLLPICSYCKKVRDDNNYWQQVETYISERTGTLFSHGVCPNCMENVVRPQLARMRESVEAEKAAQAALVATKPKRGRKPGSGKKHASGVGEAASLTEVKP